MRRDIYIYIEGLQPLDELGGGGGGNLEIQESLTLECLILITKDLYCAEPAGSFLTGFMMCRPSSMSNLWLEHRNLRRAGRR